MSTTEASPLPAEFDRVQRIALLAGVIGLGVLSLSLLTADTRDYFFRAWLVGFNLPLGIALGSLPLLMLQYLTGGNWGFVLRRPLEAALGTLPLLALLCVPILLGLPWLYEWARPEAVAASELLKHKAPYLNVPFMIGRTAACFGIWILLGWLLIRWSKAADATRSMDVVHRCESLSAAGLILYVLTITIYSIDFVMSLEAEWYSTIYGAMFGMGQVLAAFAFTVALFVQLSNRPPFEAMATSQLKRDHGSFLLAFVMIWAYLSFSQFLLIWSGNLPEETPWYIKRLEHGRVWIGLALVLFHFALPFILLLSTDIKRNRGAMVTVTLVVLIMRAVDLYWLIGPAFDRHGHGHGEAEAAVSHFPWGVLFYPAALIGLSGIWLAFYLRNLRRMPLLPSFNPNEEAEVHGTVATH